MKKTKLTTNNKAQVLGLPMYLIIIMIVAVAVIAAVVMMIPQANKMMNAQITPGVIEIQEDGTQSETTTITINVTTKDDRSDPITDATVTLVGGGKAYSQTTDSSGTATFTVSGLTLDTNINEAYLKATITAAGFEDYIKDQAVLLYRL